MTLDLFPEYEDTASGPPAPLAERMRPESWDDFAGHESLVGPKGPLRLLFARDSTLSFILWGPPGSGKTTIARICAKVTNSEFYEISAVQSGIAELRKVVAAAKLNWKSRQRRTLLFIDEIHRFNKVQQDAILPFVEDGTLSLIGSTPENPSFEVIPALLSRCQVFRMETLSPDTLRSLVARALLDKERGLGETPVELQEESMTLLIRYANGDARRALNGLEAAVRAHLQDADPTQPLAPATMAAVLQHAAVLYDKGGNEHYDHASAFQKSLRGSDPDAAIYWLAKMIAGGEDPEFIARRLVVTAAEDVGNADPMALLMATAAAEAVRRIGLPEARIPLAQAVLYVARAPKDNAAIAAIDEALRDIQRRGRSYPVPDHLKDTHYRDGKARYGFGEGYKYPHDYPGNRVAQDYLPPELKGRKYLPDSRK